MYVFDGGADPETEKPLRFIPGIPARTLTNAEWRDLTKAQRALARKEGLYRYERDPRPKAIIAPAPAATPEPAPADEPDQLEHEADDQADETEPAGDPPAAPEDPEED